MVTAFIFLDFLVISAFTSDAQAEPLTIKVMTYNIRSGIDNEGAGHLEEVLRIINAEKPDILGIQEIKINSVKYISAQTGLWSCAGVPSYGMQGQGLGVFSKWPFQIETVPIAGSNGKRNAARARLFINGQALSFYCVHFSRDGIKKKDPLGAFRLEMSSHSPRLAQAKSLVQTLSRDGALYKIMAGDFNTFTNSRPYAIIRETMSEAFSGSGSSSGTYRGGWLFEPKIDHIFYNNNLEVINSYVIRKGVSDHYPVVAVFTLNTDPDNSMRSRMEKHSKNMIRGD